MEFVAEPWVGRPFHSKLRREGYRGYQTLAEIFIALYYRQGREYPTHVYPSCKARYDT
jgi:hypothetical protein